MICGNCKIDRSFNDFIKNQKFCYRCEYRIKLENVPKKRRPKPKFCRICAKEVIHVEHTKKRQRTVFCSLECAAKGHKERIENYWTRKLQCGSFA